MKVVVTGANGFVGQNVCNAIADAGHIVYEACHRSCNCLEHRDVLEYMRGRKPHAIVHLAGTVGGIGANARQPGKFFYNNMLMGMNVIDVAKHLDLNRLIMVGTVCSYPKYTQTPFSEKDLWNGYPEETNAPYGIAKRALIEMCRAYNEQYGLDSICLLPANMYGPHDHFDLQDSHVVPALMRKIHSAMVTHKDTVQLWGSGKATREFLYVKDFAKAVVKALYCTPCTVPINIGTGYETSISTLAATLAEIIGFEGFFTYNTSHPDGQPRRRLLVERAQRLLDWKATTSLEDGLRLTYEWYKERLSENPDFQ